MADNAKILLSGDKDGDQIKIDPSVLEVILGIAADKIDGVIGMRGDLTSGIKRVLGRDDRGKGVNVRVDDNNQIIADIYVYLKAGVNVPTVAMKMQKQLKIQLLQMTDLQLREINIHVVGLVFPEEEKKHDEKTEKLFPEDAKQ